MTTTMTTMMMTMAYQSSEDNIHLVVYVLAGDLCVLFYLVFVLLSMCRSARLMPFLINNSAFDNYVGMLNVEYLRCVR